jgi:hydrogenase maturation factor HypE
MSFIKPMNAQNRLTPMKKVVHQAYERPKSVEPMKNVVHRANEQQKSFDVHEKCRSSS